MKKLLIACLLMAISVSVTAKNDELQSSIKNISTELASINQQLLDAYQLQNESANMGCCCDTASNIKKTHQNKISKNQTQDMYEIIIREMYSLKKKYDNNPYVKIAGFDVNIAIPPSITVSIEFKK